MDSGHRANKTHRRRYNQSHNNLEARGQRLSNPNDPNDQSLLILFSAQRHSQPLQTKLSEMNAKCSCSKMAPTELEKCLTTLERKQQKLIEDRKCKVLRSRKEKRDAATSPQLPCKDAIDSSKSKEVNLKIYNSPGRSGNVVRLSPRRDIPTRNAATSPQVESRRQVTNCATVDSGDTTMSSSSSNSKSSTIAPKMCLEKSKSLCESRPQRQLRTTRSLSPRPPMRHQQAIIISDENDVVLKVTPSEDIGCDGGSLKTRKTKAKSQSEQTSPNLSDCGTFFPEDQYANNRSTGCLVYVPSDPWMKMNSNQDSKAERSATSRRKTSNDNDPWIHRNSENQNSKSPKSLRQSQRSGSSKLDDKTLHSRPAAQQRCKSPAINDDVSNESRHKTSAENLMLSPQKSHSPTTSLTLSPLDNPKRPKNSLLSVNNSNLLQPRHSFSSPSQKDDELQLNIRRLSEQIKSGGYSTTFSGCGVAPSTDFTSYLNQIRKDKTLTKGVVRNSDNGSNGNVVIVDADVVLETTC